MCIKWYLQLIKLTNHTDHIWRGRFCDINLHLSWNHSLGLTRQASPGRLEWSLALLHPGARQTSTAGSPRWLMHARTCRFDGVNQTFRGGKSVFRSVPGPAEKALQTPHGHLGSPKDWIYERTQSTVFKFRKIYVPGEENLHLLFWCRVISLVAEIWPNRRGEIIFLLTAIIKPAFKTF